MGQLSVLGRSNQLQTLTQAARERRVRDAADLLGADLDSVEGILAARAYAIARQLAEDGFLSGAPERGARARVIAEAIALYEMYQPGLFTLPNANAAEAAERARQLAAAALAALEADRLIPVEGELAEGWVEVFPELTEDERRLGQLPGFTPERIEQWLEVFPAEDLGLPTSTATPIPEDPTGNIISTPLPEETGPNIVEARPGTTTTPAGNTILPHGDKGDGREYVTSKGHTVEQIDDIIANPRPDLSGILEGRGALKGQDVILLTGQDGHWVKLDNDGNVRATSNRNLPLRHDENNPGKIIRPLE